MADQKKPVHGVDGKRPIQLDIPGLDAVTGWFHVFRALIESGDLARMGPHAFACYAVLKAHAGHTTGQAFPGVERIAELSGVSARQVKRELARLAELGYVVATKRGRSNVYTLRERVEVLDPAGQVQAVASWDYVPASVAAAVADLRRVLVSGQLGGAQLVHIEHLTVQVAAPGAAIVNIDARGQAEEARERLRVLADELRATVDKRGR